MLSRTVASAVSEVVMMMLIIIKQSLRLLLSMASIGLQISFNDVDPTAFLGY